MSRGTDLRMKILAFRNKELQQCLERLGLNKKGRKAELQQRLLTVFGQSLPSINGEAGPSAGSNQLEQWRVERAGKLVDTVYNEMRSGYEAPAVGAAAATLLQRQQQQPRQQVKAEYGTGCGVEQILVGSGAAPAAQAGAVGAAGPSNTRIRCLCDDNKDRGTPMIQCEGAACGVWQHCACVGVQGNGSFPESFYCECCRMERADPFWEPAQPGWVLAPTRLRLRPYAVQAPQGVQSLDRVVHLTPQHVQLVKGSPDSYRLLVMCLAGGDTVLHRFHWPKQCELRVNSVQYRVYGRNPAGKVGPSVRDEPANIGSMVFGGRNSLTLQCSDPGPYIVMVQLMRRRSVTAVRSMMVVPEPLELAKQRVVRTICGGDQNDEDDDDDLVAMGGVLSLRDPLTATRMITPARFTNIVSLQAFDLDTFLDLAGRTRKWMDPHTLTAGTVYELQVDAYLSRVLSCLQSAPDVNEVEISPQGQWRPKGLGLPWRVIEDDSLVQLGGAAAGVSAARAGSAAANAGGDAAVALLSDSDEESEGAELRAAAAAVADLSRKRKAAEPPDVINLISSDDEDDATASALPPQRQQQCGLGAAGTMAGAMPSVGGGLTAAVAQAAGADGGRESAPISIRLPPRASYTYPLMSGISSVASVAPPLSWGQQRQQQAYVPQQQQAHGLGAQLQQTASQQQHQATVLLQQQQQVTALLQQQQQQQAAALLQQQRQRQQYLPAAVAAAPQQAHVQAARQPAVLQPVQPARSAAPQQAVVQQSQQQQHAVSVQQPSAMMAASSSPLVAPPATTLQQQQQQHAPQPYGAGIYTHAATCMPPAARQSYTQQHVGHSASGSYAAAGSAYEVARDATFPAAGTAAAQPSRRVFFGMDGDDPFALPSPSNGALQQDGAPSYLQRQALVNDSNNAAAEQDLFLGDLGNIVDFLP